jgi:dTDP-4-dehydrorhamnose reductase
MIGRRVLVTGASGLLGLNLAIDASRQGYTVIGLVNRHGLRNAPFEVRSVDLTQIMDLQNSGGDLYRSGKDHRKGTLAALLDDIRPEVVIHCAALAHLDPCEADPARAELINARLPGILALETARRGVQMVHVSTDAIFDGIRGGYREEDEPHPLNVYARTKLMGEQAVISANPQAIVARVNFFGWSLSGNHSLAEFFYNNLSVGRAVKGFTDLFFCTMLVNDLGRLLLKMAEFSAQEVPCAQDPLRVRGLSGVFHATGSTCLSKYEFGVRLARQFGFDENLVIPSRVAEGNLLARRSPNMTLDTTRLAEALGSPLPGVEQGLANFYELYRQGYPDYLKTLSL